LETRLAGMEKVNCVVLEGDVEMITNGATRFASGKDDGEVGAGYA
jgi:hypothetical protein